MDTALACRRMLSANVFMKPKCGLEDSRQRLMGLVKYGPRLVSDWSRIDCFDPHALRELVQPHFTFTDHGTLVTNEELNVLGFAEGV